MGSNELRKQDIVVVEDPERHIFKAYWPGTFVKRASKGPQKKNIWPLRSLCEVDGISGHKRM